MSDLPPLPLVRPTRYRHYKGGEYLLVGAARHSETLEPLALYRPLYGHGDLWVRPWAMFFEEVLIDGVLQPRFRPLDPPLRSAPLAAAQQAYGASAKTCTIVPISEAHAEGFHACLDTVAREGRYLAQTEARPLEQVRTFVRDSVRQGVAQFVALDGERVVGWADIFPAWAQAWAHSGTLGMGVLPAYRGQGLGKRLLLTVLARAQAQGLTRVSLEARADNDRAIALYSAVGFRHEGLRRKALRFNGEYHDAVQMGLLMGEAAD